MPARSSQVRVVVLSRDSRLAAQIEQDDDPQAVTVVKDLPMLKKAMASRSFHGVVLGGSGAQLEDFTNLGGHIDLAKTYVLAGPVASMDSLYKFVQWVGDDRLPTSKSENGKGSLVDYVEAKFGEFVRAMKSGSARDLYPTLIRAVERPLIELALKETNGNQMQAAQLLGVNRNTLRKKIEDLKISVKRRHRFAAPHRKK